MQAKLLQNPMSRLARLLAHSQLVTLNQHQWELLIHCISKMAHKFVRS